MSENLFSQPRFVKAFKNRIFLVLFCVFLAGTFLRFYNLNWDEGYMFHPDEKNLVAASTRISVDDSNPHFFNYGGFSIYLYRFIAELAVFFGGDAMWTKEWSGMDYIGRNVSAFVSSLTILLVFFLSRAVFNDKKVALLASFFTAFTVYLVQAAHFAVTDTLVIFWLLLIYIESIKAIQKNGTGNYEKIGMFSGLALATKMSSISFLIIPFFVYLYHIVANINEKNGKVSGGGAHFINMPREWIIHLVKNGHFLVRFIFFTFVFFFLFSPYSLLDFGHFNEWWAFENGVVSGKLKFEIAYTYQFMETIPYVFQLKNLFWLQGALLQMFSVMGAVYVLYLAIKKRNIRYFLLVVWPLAYFYIIGGWYAKFVRYMAPLLPFLAIFAAKLLVDFQKKKKVFGNVLIAVTMLSVLLYSFAFVSIYKKESTRIAASKWIYENIPAGSNVLTEWSDDQLPISFQKRYPGYFNIAQLNVYGSDNEGKRNYFFKNLSESDYMVISSRRLYGTFLGLKNTFPDTAKYYRLLLGQKLGYDIIAIFSSYPSLYGFEINDDSSEETFQVFDHPKVIILKNVRNMSPKEYAEIFKSTK